MSAGVRSYSQAGQDLFVLEVLKGKKNGRFIEIGANHPFLNSNSWVLEEDFGWRGLMIEYDPKFEAQYREHRVSPFVIQDARTVDYFGEMKKHNFPVNVDYLQIDLDVNNRSTMDVLERFEREIFPTYKFATVTFEHDFYLGDYFNTRQASREIFSRNGYQLVFPDVCHVGRNFEDWYVHPSLVDKMIGGMIVEKNYQSVIEYLRSRKP